MMAAASYYDAASSMRSDEEQLEIQARDIDQKALLLQARLRGFLVSDRVSRPRKGDVAIDSIEHLASMNQGRYRDTHSITSEIVNERRNSDINKIRNKHIEHDEHGDKYTQKDNICGYKSTPGKAQNIDLHARWQESINSAANTSERDSNYSKANDLADDTLSR